MSTNILIVNGYDIRTIVADVKSKYPNIESSDDLEKLESLYFDHIQACDLNECKMWLTHYIKEGLNDLEQASEMYMPEQRNSRAQLEYEGYLKILAAYNLYPEKDTEI